jgi:predicted enzyme related to lactoylglutathione lyase
MVSACPHMEESSMAITNALASVPVNDLRTATQWYETLFGRPADSNPMPEVSEWKFERGGWLQVYESRQRAGSGSVTLAVESLDEQIEHLQKLGVDAGQPMIMKVVKVIMIKDPDGNSIAFAEATDPRVAQ